MGSNISLLWALLAAGSAVRGATQGFDLGTGRFLAPGAVEAPAAVPVAVAPAESLLLAKAIEAAGHLSRAGHLQAATAFHPVTDPQYADSAAYVTYDFPRGVCDVFIGEKAMEEAGFAGGFMLRFVLYHELAHCHLYANPREIRAIAGLSDRANRMLSDFVHLEFFRVHDGDGFKTNGYGTYHETYADVKAMAVLLAEGARPEQAREVVRMRESDAFSFMDTHDNAGVFERLLAMPWASYDAARLEDEARAVADAFIRGNVFAKMYSPVVWEFTPFMDVLAGSLQSPVSHLNYAGTDPEIRKTIEEQLRQAAASPQPVWREYARLVRQGFVEDRLVEEFFRARYGAGRATLAEEDNAIRRALQAPLAAARDPGAPLNGRPTPSGQGTLRMVLEGSRPAPLAGCSRWLGPRGGPPGRPHELAQGPGPVPVGPADGHH